jgi:tRNA (cmo5U34)-methyltransferase
MERCDHHDWASETYVDEWVRQQQSQDGARAERFQLMCDLFPFSTEASVTILDLGAGYGPASTFILDRYPRATCIGQDGSEPMLDRARKLMARYGERFKPHQSDLFETSWLPEELGPFDAAVSSICLHNLRDFRRIGEIYGEIHAHLKSGGVFLNLDLVNAPTAGLQQRYASAGAAGRQRDGASGADVEAMIRGGGRSRAQGATGPFPASVDQHLVALRAAGFQDVDCFWKELRLALCGGYA